MRGRHREHHHHRTGLLAGAARASRVELRKIIEDAIAAGELVRTADSRQLARTVEAVVGGSMMAWAYYEEGPASRWMRHDLDAVLEPYLPKRKKTSGRASTTGPSSK